MRVVTDITLGAHLRGSTHPESPDRVERVAAALRSRADTTVVEESFEADDATLTLVHPQIYPKSGAVLQPYGVSRRWLVVKRRNAR